MKKIILLIQWLLKLLKNNYRKVNFYNYCLFYYCKNEIDIRITKYINKILSKINYLYIPKNCILHCISSPSCHLVELNKRQIIKIRQNWLYLGDLVFCETCEEYFSLDWRL